MFVDTEAGSPCREVCVFVARKHSHTSLSVDRRKSQGDKGGWPQIKMTTVGAEETGYDVC
jgi:hypothetical protein